MEQAFFLNTLLNRELIPATGCTELGAVALAAGWAVYALGDPHDIQGIDVKVDQNTYKNAMGVGVPGTEECGLSFAASMGALSPMKVGLGLQILENADVTTVENARKLIKNKRVNIFRVSGTKDMWIQVRVRNSRDETMALIQGSHDHVIRLEKNGKTFQAISEVHDDLWKGEMIKSIKYQDLIEFAQNADIRELPKVREALEMNMKFADEARNATPFSAIASAMGTHDGAWGSDDRLSERIQFITAIAVEARMKGLDFPVMACGGSGNQGLVATIPVVEMSKRLDAPEEKVLRALALSYLTTIFVKAFTGVLSPVCGCGVAAAVGAGCGIVFLRGGEASQIEAQINNMIGTMAGIICDGAKSGCSFKALMAVGLALDSSDLSLENIRIPAKDGIVGKDVTETLRNLDAIIERGMSSMDSAIVEIMET
jgi:L-cysteine desulfidase